MTAPIVERLDLKILGSQPPIAVLVLNARVRELNVAVLLWEVMLDGPALDLCRRLIGPAVAVRAATIPLLKELLIVAFELVVEDDTWDARTFGTEPLSSLQVRSIDLRVVGKLSWLPKPRIELLSRLESIRLFAIVARPSFIHDASCGERISLFLPADGWYVMTLKNVSTSIRQDHQGAVASGGWRDLHEASLLEVSEIARARSE